MTERPGTAEDGGEQAPDLQWHIDGAESYGDGGLGDTVVRIPRISDVGHAPEVPTAPKAPTLSKDADTTKAVPTARPVTTAPMMSVPTMSVPTIGGPVPSAPAASVPPAPVKPAPSVPAAPTAAFAVPAAATTAEFAAPAAPAASPVSAATEKPKASGLRRTRKARLRLSRVDPWSVMKTSFLFSIAFGIMFWVSVSVVWSVIVNSGLFDVINDAIVNIVSNPSTETSFRIEDYVSTNKILGVTALLAVINVVISTALGTLTAFLYNLSSNILGGLELTLAED